MSPLFRVIIHIGLPGNQSVFTSFHQKRRKCGLKRVFFGYSFPFFLLVFAIFPFVPDFMARSLGIYSTPNFLFLLVIFYPAFTALSYPCGIGKAGGKGQSYRAGYGLGGEKRKRKGKEFGNRAGGQSMSNLLSLWKEHPVFLRECIFLSLISLAFAAGFFLLSFS